MTEQATDRPLTLKNRVLIWKGVYIEDDAFVGPGVPFTRDRLPRGPRMLGMPSVASRYERQENWLECSKSRSVKKARH
jgi:hypothetical protein